MKNLSGLLSREERDDVRANIGRARTLPRHAFIDEDFFQYETQAVLRRSWMAIAFSAQIQNPGDILPMTVLERPILLVRDRDGTARAFHNVSPYDGCEIAIWSKQGLESIVTPYHGWEYALDGTLIGANYWDGQPTISDDRLQALDADLKPVACVEWLSTLFVWLEDEAKSFEECNQAVIQHWETLDQERLGIGRNAEGAAQIVNLDIAANWKTVYENYSPNVYHESFVHAIYRKSPHSPRVNAEGQKTYTEINHPSGFLGLYFDDQTGRSIYGEPTLPPLRLKDGGENRHFTIANVFPNWVITLFLDRARVALFLPHGPETGTQVLATLFDREAAIDPPLVKERERALRMGIIAREEDNRICESIQRARHSPAVASQFYSPFWDAMHYTLSNLILDRLEQGDQ